MFTSFPCKRFEWHNKREGSTRLEITLILEMKKANDGTQLNLIVNQDPAKVGSRVREGREGQWRLIYFFYCFTNYYQCNLNFSHCWWSSRHRRRRPQARSPPLPSLTCSTKPGLNCLFCNIIQILQQTNNDCFMSPDGRVPTHRCQGHPLAVLWQVWKAQVCRTLFCLDGRRAK